MRASSALDDGRRQRADGLAPGPSGTLPTVVSGPWAALGHDGRLMVFAHVDQAVLRWTEIRPAGPDWSGPDVMAAEGVGSITLAQGRNRYVHLIGRRVRGTDDAPPAVDLVYAVQYQAGRPLSEWRSVGNPHAKRERTAQMGVPAATVDAAGTLYVFVPTAEGRVALRREGAQGQWEPWRDLQVAAALDTPAAAATSTGRVELLAPAFDGALTWYQRQPGGPLERGHDLAVAPLPGSATAVETSPDRLTYVLTDVRSGGIVVVRPGEWPVPVGGNPGDGCHAALVTVLDGYPCMVLAHRDAGGRIVLGVCPVEDERNGVWWIDTTMACLGDPVLALDGRGRVVVLAVAPDGTLILARQEEGPGLTLGDWKRI
ncbi:MULTISPECIES: hypothetical protein [unclassified Streptomyces]|uniref:hypothetical protein n=1 Tax=unclassified Streptomyces TaxID=2593676 RepID=UPI003700FFD6